MNPLLKDIFSEARTLITAARNANVKIAVAESCTGGLIGAAITSINGSSNVFLGGVIAYNNAVKIAQLGVPETEIEAHGAVSESVAKAMAEGVLTQLKADIAISVTGIAGPSGGTAAKPVGTVWMGIAHRHDTGITCEAILHEFGDIGRNRVRDLTVLEALKQLNSRLNT